jgi:DNA-binding transcriptional MerR regulator
MRIGELAHGAGVTTSRIRFYEMRGLLAPPARTSAGYREYGPRDLKIIAFIERAQRLGFSLREIGAFINSPPNARSVEAILPLLEAKLGMIDAHIAEAGDRRREIIGLIEDLRRSPIEPR